MYKVILAEMTIRDDNGDDRTKNTIAISIFVFINFT